MNPAHSDAVCAKKCCSYEWVGKIDERRLSSGESKFFGNCTHACAGKCLERLIVMHRLQLGDYHVLDVPRRDIEM